MKIGWVKWVLLLSLLIALASAGESSKSRSKKSGSKGSLSVKGSGKSGSVKGSKKAGSRKSGSKKFALKEPALKIPGSVKSAQKKFVSKKSRSKISGSKKSHSKKSGSKKSKKSGSKISGLKKSGPKKSGSKRSGSKKSRSKKSGSKKSGSKKSPKKSGSKKSGSKKSPKKLGSKKSGSKKSPKKSGSKKSGSKKSKKSGSKKSGSKKSPKKSGSKKSGSKKSPKKSGSKKSGSKKSPKKSGSKKSGSKKSPKKSGSKKSGSKKSPKKSGSKKSGSKKSKKSGSKKSGSKKSKKSGSKKSPKKSGSKISGSKKSPKKSGSKKSGSKKSPKKSGSKIFGPKKSGSKKSGSKRSGSKKGSWSKKLKSKGSWSKKSRSKGSWSKKSKSKGSWSKKSRSKGSWSKKSRSKGSRSKKSRSKGSRSKKSRSKGKKSKKRGKKSKKRGFGGDKEKSALDKYGCSCAATGDPHFTSCDNKRFDFQGKCSYVLSTNMCPGNEEAALQFKVIISTVRWKKSSATVTKKVTIVLKKKDAAEPIRLVLDENIKRILVDGISLPIPQAMPELYSAYIGKKELYVDVPGAFRVKWRNGMNVYLSLHDDYVNGVCGLCGNYNSDESDDYIKRGETVAVEDVNEFGHSWLVDEGIKGCDVQPKEEENPCEKQEVRDEVENFCGRMKKDAFADCYANEASKKFIDSQYQDCVADLCRDVSRKTDLCSYPEGVADHCEENGFAVGVWQCNDFCAAEQCTGGMVFKQHSSGNYRCENPESVPAATPSSGCFCPDGMFLDGTTCVTLEGCGCALGGFYLKRGTHLLLDDCTRRLHCPKVGEMVDKQYQCGENAKCVTENERMQCVCKNGFDGDGKNCFGTGEPNTIGVGSDGELGKSSFTSSSPEKGVKPWDVRLDGPSCWRPLAGEEEPWVKVALLNNFRIFGVRIQRCPEGPDTITGFTIYYSEDGKDYKPAQTFGDLTIADPYTDVMLENTIPNAQFVKLVPQNDDGPIGLRIEVLAERSDCKKGHHAKLRSCYMLVNNPKSYHIAQQICAASEAYLAEIFDVKENEYLRSLAAGQDIILGVYLDRESGDGKYVNDHGSHGNYLNFPEGHKPQEDNVKMSASGEWVDIRPDQRLAYVCENGGGNDCPASWQKKYGGCYKLIEEKLTFGDADKRCQAEGGHIVQVTSPAENDAVSTITKESTWIAVTDRKEEGHFLLHPRQRPLPFTSWANSEPNDWGTGEDCATTNWKQPGKWNDAKCNQERKTLCEWGLSTHHVYSKGCDNNPCVHGRCVAGFNFLEEIDNYKCACHDGYGGENCDKEQCWCFAWGDPHFRTCDKRKFDFQGKCHYIMAQNGCDNMNDRTFQIAIKTVNFPSYPGTSKAEKVYILLDWENCESHTHLTLDQGGTVYVNNVEAQLPFTLRSGAIVSSEGRDTVVEPVPGVKVKWDGKYRVDIYIDDSYKNKGICGLCGDFDGEDNEFRDFNGDGKSNHADIDLFGVANRLNKEDCTQPPPPPPPVEDVCAEAPEENRQLLQLLLAKLEAEEFKNLIAVLDDNDATIVKSVIHDMKMEACSSGDKVRSCEGLKSLVHNGVTYGVDDFCWDPEGDCQPKLGENEIYFCGQGAEMNCGDTEESIKLRVKSYDGPKCIEGYRRLGAKCVHVSECGCTYEVPGGEEKFTLEPMGKKVGAGCNVEYSCVWNDGEEKFEIHQEPHECHVDADCFDDSVCTCRARFEGSGYDCKPVPDETDDLEGYDLGVSCGGILPDSAITLNPTAPEIAILPRERKGGKPFAPEIQKAGRLCGKGDNYFKPPRDSEDPYIEINLVVKTPVRAVITKGWKEEKCWPESIIVKYRNNQEDEWRCAQDENGDCRKFPTSFKRKMIAVPEFRARYVRIIPQFSADRKVCLQVELFGGDPVECPESYKVMASGCYKLFEKEKPYESAASRCSESGGYIVEVSSANEDRLVKLLADGRDIFLGLRAVKGTSRFSNPMGSPNYYSNYAKNEPSIVSPEWECISKRPEGKWYRENCKVKKAVLCEAYGDAPKKIPPGKRLGAEFGGELTPPQFTASSFKEPFYPDNGRLFKSGVGCAWAPEPSDEKPWIQVRLNNVHKITGLIMQGCCDAPEYVQKFHVRYSQDCENFKKVSDDDGVLMFLGPTDSDTQVTIIFKEFFKALCVRVYPESQEVPIALRLEWYGKFVEPDIPCMDGLLADREKVPDSAFSTSSCPLREGVEEGVDLNYCAKDARWTEGDVFWSPSSTGACEFSEVNFGRSVLVRGIKVRSRDLPEFRVQYSADGIFWECAYYKIDEATFPGDGDEPIKFLKPLEAHYLRVTPVSGKLPALMYEVLGCEMEKVVKAEIAEIAAEAPIEIAE